MMDFFEILRGYTTEQYAETLFQVMVNFLLSKGIIQQDEFQKFVDENFNDILQKVIDRDREKHLTSINKDKSAENV